MLTDEYIARFERRYPAFWEPHPRPTTHSIARISTHFGITVPGELVQLARETEHFSSLFLSLGPDYDNPEHIIRCNSYWRRRRRTRRLPKDLAIITRGFMDEDFHCLVRAVDPSRAVRVRYWSPAPIGFPKDMILGEPLDDFAAYFRWICEPRTSA